MPASWFFRDTNGQAIQRWAETVMFSSGRKAGKFAALHMLCWRTELILILMLQLRPGFLRNCRVRTVWSTLTSGDATLTLNRRMIPGWKLQWKSILHGEPLSGCSRTAFPWVIVQVWSATATDTRVVQVQVILVHQPSVHTED